MLLYVLNSLPSSRCCTELASSVIGRKLFLITIGFNGRQVVDKRQPHCWSLSGESTAAANVSTSAESSGYRYLLATETEQGITPTSNMFLPPSKAFATWHCLKKILTSSLAHSLHFRENKLGLGNDKTASCGFYY